MSTDFLHHLHMDLQLHLFRCMVHSLLHALVYTHTSVGAFFVCWVCISVFEVYTHTFTPRMCVGLCVCARCVYKKSVPESICWQVCLKAAHVGGSVTLCMHT